MGVKIITDNCCDLPEDILDVYNISVVPLQVRFGDEELPRKGFSNQDFYERMRTSSNLPSTNQPSPGDFLLVYKEAREKELEVVSIHLSSGISGTVQSASLAAQMMKDKNVHVVDSLKASVGEGLMVLEAARMAQSGADVHSILKRLQEMQARLHCVFVVGNLDALLKGGRLTRTKAIIAGTLGIKPVLHINETGRIVPFDRARGHKGAQLKLMEIMDRLGADIAHQTVGICHSDCRGDALYLRESIQTRFAAPEIVIGEIGPVIGSHVGPGTFSVFFQS